MTNVDDKLVKVVVVHPDLGLGGAERLIVDLSKALQESRSNRCRFDVEIYTGYHDKNRCFEETCNGLLKVYSKGEWIPRNLFGRFHALLAYLKMLYIAIYLLLFKDFDIFICDQVPICIPVLRLKPRFKKKSRAYIFYCHFPDQLLTSRKTRLKTLYRTVIDKIEESSIKTADTVLVNSEFTREVFCDTFKSWKNSKTLEPPEVLYPCVDVDRFSSFDPKAPPKGTKIGLQYETYKTNFLFLSLNRFERKKDLGLAITAFDKFFQKYRDRKKEPSDTHKDPHLIVAGGYDARLLECVEYYNDLKELVKKLNLDSHVTFIKTPNDEEKLMLLSLCKVVVYTPQNEHFGIVPLEAMAMGKPVIATASGGPIETISVNEKNRTGYLCEPGDEESFSDSMLRVVLNDSERERVGLAGLKWVRQRFSFQVFQRQIERICIQSVTD